MASAPRGTSSPKSVAGRGGACSPSPGRATHAGQAFARSVGVEWAGGSDEKPPEPLDAAILFAPVGALVPAALAAIRKGGRVVCGGIHMSDIPAFPYRLLWEERSVASVANLTRADGHEFLGVAPQAKVRTTTTPYPLDKANEALDDLRRAGSKARRCSCPEGPTGGERPPAFDPPFRRATLFKRQTQAGFVSRAI